MSCKITIFPATIDRAGRVLVDGTEVGIGSNEACTALAEELRKSSEKAAFLRDLCREPLPTLGRLALLLTDPA